MRELIFERSLTAIRLSLVRRNPSEANLDKNRREDGKGTHINNKDGQLIIQYIKDEQYLTFFRSSSVHDCCVVSMFQSQCFSNQLLS